MIRRRLLWVVATVVIGIAIVSGCGVFSNTSSPGVDAANTVTSTKKETVPTGKKPLVVYFSQPETNKTEQLTREEDNSMVVIDGKAMGNTQYVATLIQKKTGADLLRIEPATPYPTDHRTLVAQAKEEQRQQARPAIATKMPDLSRYDLIFVGYPIWWADLPMIMYTFLENADLSGKTIVPFSTHGGSGFADTIDTIATLAPKADVVRNGLTISRDDVQAEAAQRVTQWLAVLEY